MISMMITRTSERISMRLTRKSEDHEEVMSMRITRKVRITRK